MSTIPAPEAESAHPPAPAAPAPAKRPFSVRDKLGYMFGDFGNDFTFLLQSAFFMIFYTNVMGISAAHVGTLLFAARILDAFTDVGAGRLVDTLRPGRSGRFKPWLLRIMIPVAVAAVLMFSPFLQDGSYGARLAWMTVTYVLWGSVFYTLINIPYGSMASVISNKPGERSSLSVFRALGGTLANLAISVILPLVVYVQIDGRSELSGSRMMFAAIACAVLAVFCYLLCFVNVEERIATPPKPKEERMGFVKTMGTLVTNRALTGIVAGALLMLIGQMVLMAIMPYVFNEYFNHGSLLSIVNLVGLLPTLLLVPFATMFGKRFGKKEFSVFGMALAVVAAIILFVVRTESPIVFTVGYTVMMLGIACINLLVWAFITDVIDYQEIRTGERNDATVYALYSWARKLGQAFAGGLAGWALGAIGYQPGGVQQDDAVLDGIYNLATVFPAIILGLSGLAFAFWYPLSKKRVNENVATLERKHAEEGTQA